MPFQILAASAAAQHSQRSGIFQPSSQSLCAGRFVSIYRSLHFMFAICVALRGPSVFGLRLNVTSVSSFTARGSQTRIVQLGFGLGHVSLHVVCLVPDMAWLLGLPLGRAVSQVCDICSQVRIRQIACCIVINLATSNSHPLVKITAISPGMSPGIKSVAS